MGYLTEDQELMLDAVRELCEAELEPRVLTDIESGVFLDDFNDRMREMGLHLLTIPEEHGGMGQSTVAKTAIEMEIAKHSMAMAVFGTDSAVPSLLLSVGTPEQVERYLPELLEGHGGFGFTEPNAGSDSSAIQTTAVKDGDEWVINGQKTFISFVNQCNYFLVSARTNETGNGGISTFLVPSDAPGFKVGSVFHKLGFKASDTGELFFEDVRVPEAALIGVENKGLHAVLALLDGARLGVAALACGIAEAGIEKAAEFAKQRVAFGKPIAAKQGIQWYFAEMRAKLDAAKALTFEVARTADEGGSITAGAAEAKWFATQAAIEVTNRAVQICGGYGLMDDFGVERLYRDAKCCSIIEGTDEILKIVISRGVLS